MAMFISISFHPRSWTELKEKMKHTSYDIEDYDYPVPPEIVAQRPSEGREDAKLLIVNRATGEFEHSYFSAIGDWLDKRDLLVLNDTKVIPARLFGTKDTGGKVEVLLIDPNVDVLKSDGEANTFECIVRASKRPKVGSRLFFSPSLSAEVAGEIKEGKGRLRFISDKPLKEALEEAGTVPLPPYIRRNGKGSNDCDLVDYQTVYAKTPGAVASPTAGLHFTEVLLERLKKQGVKSATITLHVGYGTFTPIRCKDVREHIMHPEYLRIDRDQAEIIRGGKKKGKRIVAIGTTVVRALEFVATKFGSVARFEGLCDHYIYPGYEFKVVDRMITNFHWPKSSLILLVSAFAGRELILKAYDEAIKKGYRFFSYGDAMLIL